MQTVESQLSTVMFSDDVLWKLIQAFALCGTHPAAQQVARLRMLRLSARSSKATCTADELVLKQHLEQLGAIYADQVDFEALKGYCDRYLRAERECRST